MFNYLFTLGHQPHISTAEIKAVFSILKIKYKIEASDKNSLVVSTEKKINTEKIMEIIGGTIKISEQIPKKQNLQETIIDHLLNVQGKGKIQFALPNKAIALDIKKKLKKLDRNSRYVEIKNTASVLHNNLVKKQGDITILHNNIFITKAIQPIEEFVQKDYERPGFDSKSGMIPPKLAKIMINLAQIKKDSNLLDPFCGSGTILVEAASMGYKNLIGSDISKKAVEDTKKNLEWIISNYQLPSAKFKIYNCDAEKLYTKIKNCKIDSIISEPYMGKPLHGNEGENFLKKQINELKKLYINSFASFHKILGKNGVVIFIIPSYLHKHNWIEIDCIEDIKKIGFETMPFEKENSLKYWRTKQHLARNIWKFEKT